MILELIAELKKKAIKAGEKQLADSDYKKKVLAPILK
jgi:hypothetical protein